MDELRYYIIRPISNVLYYHKLKVLMVFLMSFIFFAMLFPFKDISGLISTQINKATRNQVQVSFEDMGISLIPFGISASEVYILTPKFKSPLYIKKAYLSPSILSFLSFRPGGSLKAKGILGGNLQASFTNLGQGDSNNKNSKVARIRLNFNGVDMSEVVQFLGAGIKTGGHIAGDVDMQVDMAAIEQPKGSFSLKGQKIGLPGVVSLQGMDLILPEGELKTLNLAGQMKDGNLKITKSNLGQSNDVIYGKMRGNMNIKAISRGAGIAFRPGQYEFFMDLNFSKEAESKLGTMVGTVLLNGKGGRSSTLDGGARYTFSVSGYPSAMPDFKPLNQF